MPTYDYQCKNCGLRFESFLSISEYEKPQECPSCNTLSERWIPESVSSVFNVDVQSIAPQNTGISELDLHIDRVIGAHAQKGWENIKRRVADKRALLNNTPDSDPYAIVRNRDGSYRLMPTEEKEKHTQAQNVNKKVMKTIKQKKTIE
jgi:putative FmdB family regulatory protein